MRWTQDFLVSLCGSIAHVWLFRLKMGMLVAKDNLGFGIRSWRYAATINDGVVENWFEEAGFEDNCESDPYGESSPQNIMSNLKSSRAAA